VEFSVAFSVVVAKLFSTTVVLTCDVPSEVTKHLMQARDKIEAPQMSQWKHI
jgi:hypothetical protein